VIDWTPFAQRTVGEQLVRSLDSTAANAAEGDGRHSDMDSLRFFSMSKASSREARFWLVRATKRKLFTAEKGESFVLRLESVMRRFNVLVSRRRDALQVKEMSAGYDAQPENPWSDEALTS
jgi:four helix bundle protein